MRAGLRGGRAGARWACIQSLRATSYIAGQSADRHGSGNAAAALAALIPAALQA